MAFRPERFQGRGTGQIEPVPISVRIASSGGYDPAKLVTSVSFHLGPTPRPTVEAAVEAFRQVIEGER